MIVADGASVTETPRLKRGSMWYASAPFNSPILGHSMLIPVLGVGATLRACGAPPSTRSERLRARWGYEAGSPALQGGVAHNCVKRREKHLIDEKAFLISLSVGIPIDDFYEVDGRLTYRGLVNGYVADCEKYLSIIDKYDEKTILEASIYMFNLIRRGYERN